MTIIDIIREHALSDAPSDAHGRCSIVLDKDAIAALYAEPCFQRTAVFISGTEEPAGCRYKATISFLHWTEQPTVPGAPPCIHVHGTTRAVNVYEWLGEMPLRASIAQAFAEELSKRMTEKERRWIGDAHLQEYWTPSTATGARPRWKSANWDAVTAHLMAAPADPEQPPPQTPQD